MGAELDYCVPHGIPHSVFSGRVVRPGVDPEWLDTDRGYALAWMQNKAETCPRCGTRHDEWENDRDAYVGATHYCRGDDVLAMQQESLPKDDKTGRTLPGFVPYLERREVAEARERAKNPSAE